MRRCLLLAGLILALPAHAVDLKWVYVGNPGNPPDTATNCLNDAPSCGSVPYAYYISKYEVTNAQYVEFLNAVADTDTYRLYDILMDSSLQGGITRSGSSGSYTYAVKGARGNKPVAFVSWFDALRFINWLHNGQPTGAQAAGTTETGAYTLTGATSISGGANAGALAFLPTENEWYKAAYYDAATASYFEYPTSSNIVPVVEPPPGGSNSANFYDPVTGLHDVSDVGAYTGSESPYGTFDQGGNVWEWNETLADTDYRGVRGGGFGTDASSLAASVRFDDDPRYQGNDVGFRVATLVPEPAQVLLMLTGGLVLAAARRKRRA